MNIYNANWYYSKYSGVFKDIQSNKLRIIEEAPITPEDGPDSIRIVKAYLGFS